MKIQDIPLLAGFRSIIYNMVIGTTNNNIKTKRQKNKKTPFLIFSVFKFLSFSVFRFLSLSWLLVILVSGCSRTVTPIVSYGDQLVVEVTLRGNVDVNANRYFMVISDNPNYKVPLPPPDQLDAAPEFIEPGMTPLVGSAEAYFNNFFSTWSGYVVLDTTGYSLVKGPFVLNQIPTREVLATLGEINTKINFSFGLERLFTAVPDQIYFDFITVPWPIGDEKIPADHLPSTDNNIFKVLGSIVSVSDGEDINLDPSFDILDCRVEIQ